MNDVPGTPKNSYSGYIIAGFGFITTAILGFFIGRKVNALTGDKSKRQALLQQMEAMIGTPYIWGGQSKSGADCSGAVKYSAKQAGITLPETNANGLYKYSKTISPSDAEPGDAVFYGTPGDVTHVMLYAGDGKVLGATGGGQNTTSIAIANQEDAKVKYQNANYRKDIVAYGRLA